MLEICYHRYMRYDRPRTAADQSSHKKLYLTFAMLFLTLMRYSIEDANDFFFFSLLSLMSKPIFGYVASLLFITILFLV